MSARRAVDKRSLLSRLSLFSGVGEEELDQLSAYAVTRRLPERAELFHKGDAGHEAYAILSGRLQASVPSPEAKEAILSIMEPGEVFGEVAMLCGGRRTASVSALETSELLVLSRRDLLPFLERHPRVAIAALGALAERLVRLTETVEDTWFLGLAARLARKLVGLAEQYGEEQEDGTTRLDLRLSQSQLGHMLGTSRESINKQLRLWEREGLVGSRDSRIVIHDRAALEALAGARPL